MLEATQIQKEQACYVRFFNGALGLDTANIFVNGELMVQSLHHGAFSPFSKAKPGAYKLDIRLGEAGSDIVFTELISFMEDVAYTVALVGDASHLSLAVLPLDLQQDVRLPNIRFANVMPYDTVIDININGHSAADGLMFRELSDNIEIAPQNHYITVYDADNQRILEDGFTIEPGKKYLGIIAGSMGEPENLPALYVETDMPVM